MASNLTTYTNFQLSTRTLLRVSQNTGTLLFIKEQKYGPAKEVSYDAAVWAEAVQHFPDWKNGFIGLETMKINLFGDYYFVSSIWEQNKIRYSGIHRLNTASEIIPKTGINLDNYEWLAIMSKQDEIQEALYGIQENKGVKRRRIDNEIKMWTWMWERDGEKISILPQDIYFFTEEEAQKDGELRKKMNGTIIKAGDVMKTVSEFRERPQETEQMEVVVAEVVRIGIDVKKEAACAACQLDPPAPGQKAHMKSGGCLDPKINHLESYLDTVFNCISDEQLRTVYNEVCRIIGVPSHGSDILSKAALNFINCSDLEDVIRRRMILAKKDTPDVRMQPLMGYSYEPLWDLVRKVAVGCDIKQGILANIKRYEESVDM